MEKLDRIDVIYTDEEDVPAAFTKCLKNLPMLRGCDG